MKTFLPLNSCLATIGASLLCINNAWSLIMIIWNEENGGIKYLSLNCCHAVNVWQEKTWPWQYIAMYCDGQVFSFQTSFGRPYFKTLFILHGHRTWTSSSRYPCIEVQAKQRCTDRAYILDVLSVNRSSWSKLFLSTSEFHEYWWKGVVFIYLVPFI